MIALLLAVLCAGLANGCRKKPSPSRPPPRVDYRLEKVVFKIADTELRVDVTQVGTNSLTMVNLHEDERTSVQAARVIQEKYGGRLIQLVHAGVRRSRPILAKFS